MKSTPASPSTRAEMYIRQATPDTYREVLKDIRQKEIYKLIVDTNSKFMSLFFRAVSTNCIIICCYNVRSGTQKKKKKRFAFY